MTENTPSHRTIHQSQPIGASHWWQKTPRVIVPSIRANQSGPVTDDWKHPESSYHPSELTNRDQSLMTENTPSYRNIHQIQLIGASYWWQKKTESSYHPSEPTNRSQLLMTENTPSHRTIQQSQPIGASHWWQKTHRVIVPSIRANQSEPVTDDRKHPESSYHPSEPTNRSQSLVTENTPSHRNIHKSQPIGASHWWQKTPRVIVPSIRANQSGPVTGDRKQPESSYHPSEPTNRDQSLVTENNPSHRTIHQSQPIGASNWWQKTPRVIVPSIRANQSEPVTDDRKHPESSYHPSEPTNRGQSLVTENNPSHRTIHQSQPIGASHWWQKTPRVIVPSIRANQSEPVTGDRKHPESSYHPSELTNRSQSLVTENNPSHRTIHQSQPIGASHWWQKTPRVIVPSIRANQSEPVSGDRKQPESSYHPSEPTNRNQSLMTENTPSHRTIHKSQPIGASHWWHKTPRVIVPSIRANQSEPVTDDWKHPESS